MQNDDLVDILACVGNIDRHRHDSWVVHGRCAVGNRRLENIGEGPGQSSAAFLTDREDLVVSTVGASHHLFDLTDDGRVDSTAKTLVRRDGHQKRAWVSDLSRHLALQELVGFEDHVEGSAAEVLTTFESGEILLELGSRDHLHRFSDFSDVTDSLHADLQLLFTC